MPPYITEQRSTFAVQNPCFLAVSQPLSGWTGCDPTSFCLDMDAATWIVGPTKLLIPICRRRRVGEMLMERGEQLQFVPKQHY